MKDETKIKDWRSTGRRKARRELYANMVDYACVGWTDFTTGEYHPCGKTSKEPPKDAPKWFDDIWPEENRVLDSQLQADHETKDLRNNDVFAVNWRCASCHRLQDQQTAKGEAQLGQNSEDFGFGDSYEFEEIEEDDGDFGFGVPPDFGC